MKFTSAQSPVSLGELERVQSELRLTFPRELVGQYIRSNGGSPDPWVYEDDNVDTVVSSFLPIKSSRTRTAVDTYQNLVIKKKIVARHYFPFAVDGGGDYFFVDCASPEGLVYFYRADAPTGEAPLLPLGLGVDAFWSHLKPE